MKLFFYVFLFCTQLLFSQNKINSQRLHSDYAQLKSRIEFKSKLDAEIKSTFSSKLNSANEMKWSSLFGEVGLLLYRNDEVHKAVETASEYSLEGNIKFQRSLAEIIITLYPNEFTSTIDTLFATTNDPTLFAYCVYYYSKAKIKTSESLSESIKIRFPDWDEIPQLKFTVFNLEKSETIIPPLKDILLNKFIDGKTIIYSFHRKDRTYPGITIIKKPNGEFVKSENDSIFYVNQLALSVTNLPGYLSQGNTPQGIFSVVGFYNSPTPSIGPTAAVLTRIPYEVPIQLWYHSTVSKSYWDINDYKNLFPKSWQDYLPIYESYYAGKTGRRKIVMHGSVDDLSFYDTLAYAPLTPSKGCLTTTEIWSDSTGYNLKSDQAKLMNAFFSTGQLYGFLVVIDIDDKEKPVSLEEILPFIN